ncbi:hypothetical protein GPECTOR_5g147 [Gonium pectorale]|uniref:Uncharacterized protein n=1 Tax=Gonium pectorale TaxID=33097 RepID=A0A150GVX4_GONPE|nr:hypothetical protein GPECTOR_5g147 [Gonium pectorale]|eukprot:KXZ54037.1 hypothetical protein GPECTOR_5g147 [Gonium pectorale]
MRHPTPAIGPAAVRSLAGLGRLPRLRLLLLAGFELETAPSQPLRKFQPRRRGQLADAGELGPSCSGDRFQVVDGHGVRTVRRGSAGGGSGGGGGGGDGAAEDDSAPPPTEAQALRSLVEALWELRCLRYLGLCLAQRVEAPHLIRLCNGLPGLRMISLPGEADTRGWEDGDTSAVVEAFLGGARGGAGPATLHGAGGYARWPPPPEPLPPVPPTLSEKLAAGGVRAAVYRGLGWSEFWGVVDGLDAELRREGALVAECT